MQFKPYADYFDYSQLPQETIYRFAELEMNEAFNHLHTIYKYTPSPTERIYDILSRTFFGRIPTAQEYDRFQTAFMSVPFRRPNTVELINYFLYHHQSYRTIQRSVKCSPNTIQNQRFKSAPIYYPMFDNWTPEALQRWNHVKHSFNLWNEKLIAHPDNQKSPELS